MKTLPAATNDQYLDQLTVATTFDFDAISRYRAELRSEFNVNYPATLGEFDFLNKLAVLVDGLTRAGVLLFGANPTAYVPTAIVKCTHYHGTDRGAGTRKMKR